MEWINIASDAVKIGMGALIAGMFGYLVALTHYAVLYQQSPEGLPATFEGADGAPAAAAETARKVWPTPSPSPT